ncbi:hypothetical protein [Mangrovicoccus sp. HB161399]|uniref:hypothetical protein n=1 Tax=Mangrovicoccus sp. HB161399 TaxID=2720392 RepID=UPI001554D8B6|nr:hypothetical protein [Mangrovicoccus sp. HB161399]
MQTPDNIIIEELAAKAVDHILNDARRNGTDPVPDLEALAAVTEAQARLARETIAAIKAAKDKA